MGAYYAATIKQKGNDWRMYLPWDCDNGAKLMEHSFYGKKFLMSVLKLLYNRKSRLVWLCDYHEDENFNWYTFPAPKWEPIKIKKPFCIVNHTKKELYSFSGIVKAVLEKFESGNNDYIRFYVYREGEIVLYIMDPLSLLTNSEPEAAGGGDFQEKYEYRGNWKKDLMEVVSENKKDKFLMELGYTDISEKVLAPLYDYFDLKNEKEKELQRKLYNELLKETATPSQYRNLNNFDTRVEIIKGYLLKK